MSHKKKILSKIILLCMTFIMICSIQGITAFADDDPFADENGQIKIELTEIVNKLKDSGQDDSADKLSAIINALDSVDDDDEKLTENDDISNNVKNIIQEVMENKTVMEEMGAGENKFNNGLVMIQKEWINKTGEVLAAYGFTMNQYTVTNSLGESTLHKTDQTSDAEDQMAAKSSKMIQKLRWGEKNKDSQVNIVGLLKRFEEGKFATISILLQSIAAALVVAFGATNLLKISTDRMASYDSVIREFAKILFGMWFIFNYRYFTILILRFGTYFTEIILDGVSFETENSQVPATIRYALWRGLKEMMANGSADSYLKGMSSAASNILGYTGASENAGGVEETIAQLFGGVGSLLGGSAAGGTIVNLAVNWVVFAILIELAIRYVFTPIAIADLYSEGFHSNGMRWLKKLLSCCISGGLIYISMYAANIIKVQLTGIHPLQTAAINLTMIGFFVKSRMIADEIVGVR